jgi:phosphoserine aminotransferase
MPRALNFNAGPAALPLPALERAQREFLDFAGSGMSVMEHSHRGKEYEAVHNEAVSLLRELLEIPSTHEVLFLQGGASQQFATIPMNFLPAGKSADYVLTGTWGEKAVEEAKTVGQVRLAASTMKDGKAVRLPDRFEFDAGAAYAHLTSNETIGGLQFHEFPKPPAPFVCDMSSDFLCRPFDVSRFAFVYAGAQKNVGPSGVVVVVARKDFLESGRKDIPKIFRYTTHSKENSLYNTPPTFGIYLIRNVLAWLKETGGLPAMEKRNREKSDLIYGALDRASAVYDAPVDKAGRSVMNVVWTLKKAGLDDALLAEAKRAGMVGLKGHRSVGGFRASIYNAVPVEWVKALADFLGDFAKRNG